jgi:hypothetical protein
MKLVLCIDQRAGDGQSILKQKTYSHVYKHHCSRDISYTVSWFLYSMSQREKRIGVGRQEGSSFSLSWLGGGGGGGTFIFIPSRLLGVGYRVLVLFVCSCISVDGSWLSGVGCRMLTVDCRVSLSVGCCWFLVVRYRLSGAGY